MQENMGGGEKVAGLYSCIGPLSIQKSVACVLVNSGMTHRMIGSKRIIVQNSELEILISARFQDQSLVAGAAGGLVAIEVFEQGDGVFA